MEHLDLRRIFRIMPQPALLLQPKGSSFIMLEANDSYLQFTGLERKEVKGYFPPPEIFHHHPQLGKNMNATLCSFERVMDSKEPHSFRSSRPVHPAGQLDELQFLRQENIPLLDEEGEVEYLLHTVEDLSAHLLLEERDRESRKTLELRRQEYRHFMQSNGHGIFSLDIHGNFTNANEELVRLAQMPLEDLLGMSFIPFCSPADKDRVLDFFQQALDGTPSRYEAEFISGNGEQLILDVSLKPYILGKEVVGAHGIIRDFTQLRKTEKVVMEKKRFLKVQSAFISSLMEHELTQEALEEPFGVIAETVGVDRMYLFAASTQKETEELLISQQIEWNSPYASPQLNNPEMQQLSTSDLTELMGTLQRQQPFIAQRSELSPSRLRDIFLDQDIQAMLLLPVFLKERLYGFIGFDDCRQERQWQSYEIRFLQNLAHNLTTILEKKAAERAVIEREEALARNEHKFNTLVQGGSDLMGIVDQNGTFKYLAGNTLAVLGVEPENLVGLDSGSLVHKSYLHRYREGLAAVQPGQQLRIGPLRCGPEDNVRWITITATNLLHDEAIQGIVTNSHDVTQLYNQAREIEQVNERYRLAAKASGNLVYDLDLQNNKISRYYDSLEELFGYSGGVLEEHSFWRERVHPEDLPSHRKEVERARNNKNQNFLKSGYRFKRADGSYAKVIDKTYIIRDEHGQAIRLVGAITDISELMAKKEALELANNRFKLAMEVSNEMMWEWDLRINSVERGQSFKKLYGFEEGEKTREGWMRHIVPGDRQLVRHSLQQALQDPKQQRWRVEYDIQRSDGRIINVVDRAFIMRDESGKAIRMVGAALDVTESRRLLREVQTQNKVLREISWQQSHTVRAPLARFKALLLFLDDGDFSLMTEQEVLAHLHASADELDGIIKGIVRQTEAIEA